MSEIVKTGPSCIVQWITRDGALYEQVCEANARETALWKICVGGAIVAWCLDEQRRMTAMWTLAADGKAHLLWSSRGEATVAENYAMLHIEKMVGILGVKMRVERRGDYSVEWIRIKDGTWSAPMS